jgi:hypothetical protein
MADAPGQPVGFVPAFDVVVRPGPMLSRWAEGGHASDQETGLADPRVKPEDDDGGAEGDRHAVGGDGTPPSSCPGLTRASVNAPLPGRSAWDRGASGRLRPNGDGTPPSSCPGLTWASAKAPLPGRSAWDRDASGRLRPNGDGTPPSSCPGLTRASAKAPVAGRSAWDRDANGRLRPNGDVGATIAPSRGVA